MAKVVLRIRTNDGVDVFSGFQTKTEPNNISQSISDWSLVTENNGTNGKSLAKPLSLSDGFLGTANTKLQSEQDKYNGFMFGATDDSGNYSLELTIQGSAIDKIIIVGDREANQFPIEAIVDKGTENERVVYSDDPTWAIAFEVESDSHTIEFIKWNRANYNACFTTINVLSEFMELNKAWINSLNYTLDVPSSGAMASSGTAEINDLDGELYDLLKDKIISAEHLDSKIYFNDKFFQNISINDADYSIANRTVNFSLSNLFGNMQETKLGNPGNNNVMLPLSSKEYMTLKEELYSGVEYDLSRPIMTAFGEMTADEYLSGIQIPVYLLEAEETQLDRINSIAQVSQLSMFLDSNNKVNAFSSLPYYSSDKNAIVIPKSHQISDLSISEFDKNYYNKVKIPETTWTKSEQKFGASYTISLQKLESDNEDTDSTYNQIYNTSENAFAGNTHIVKLVSVPDENGNTRTDEYYKTHINIEFPDVILPYNFQFKLYLYAENENKGLKTKGENTFNSGTTTSTNIIDISLGAEENEYIKNLRYINKRHIEFDYYIYKDNVSTTGGNWHFNKKQTIRSTIQLYGEVYKQETTQLEFYNKQLDTYNTYEFPQNKFLTSETTYNGEKLSGLIANEILNNYKYSIPTGSISVFCNEYYNKNGELAKSFKNGEVFEPGDLICFEQFPDRLFKITSCITSYAGDFISDLQFEEAKHTLKSTFEYEFDGENWWIVGLPKIEDNAASPRITIPSSLNTEEYGEISIYGIKTKRSFSPITNAESYSTIKIENGIKVVAEYAFYDCPELKYVTLPESITTIEYEAFGGDTGLRQITIKATTPPQITEFSINMEGDINFMLVPKESLDIYKSTEIYNNYFRYIIAIGEEKGSKGLQYVGYDWAGNQTIDESNIARYAVEGYFGTDTDVVVPAIYKDKPVSLINHGSFYGTNSVLLPSTIHTIGDNAFNAYSGKISGGNITTLKSNAFIFVTGEINVKLAEGLGTIGSRAFTNATGLKSIVLPNSLRRIENGAFSYSGLTEIIIPENVNYIGALAFYACDNLTTMTVLASTPPTMPVTNNIPSTVTVIYVPNESLDSYKTNEWWSNYSSIMVGI